MLVFGLSFHFRVISLKAGITHVILIESMVSSPHLFFCTRGAFPSLLPEMVAQLETALNTTGVPIQDLSHSKQHAAIAIETFRVLFMENHRKTIGTWLNGYFHMVQIWSYCKPCITNGVTY